MMQCEREEKELRPLKTMVKSESGRGRDQTQNKLSEYNKFKQKRRNKLYFFPYFFFHVCDGEQNNAWLSFQFNVEVNTVKQSHPISHLCDRVNTAARRKIVEYKISLCDSFSEIPPEKKSGLSCEVKVQYSQGSAVKQNMAQLTGIVIR